MVGDVGDDVGAPQEHERSAELTVRGDEVCSPGVSADVETGHDTALVGGLLGVGWRWSLWEGIVHGWVVVSSTGVGRLSLDVVSLA